jgi:hypothetical protein
VLAAAQEQAAPGWVIVAALAVLTELAPEVV